MNQSQAEDTDELMTKKASVNGLNQDIIQRGTDDGARAKNSNSISESQTLGKEISIATGHRLGSIHNSTDSNIARTHRKTSNVATSNQNSSNIQLPEELIEASTSTKQTATIILVEQDAHSHIQNTS